MGALARKFSRHLGAITARIMPSRFRAPDYLLTGAADPC